MNVGNGKKNEFLRITEEMLEMYIEGHIVMPVQLSPVKKRTLPVRCVYDENNGKISHRKD